MRSYSEQRKRGPLSDIENAHQRALAESGLAFVVYDFRRTFATRFAEATNGDVVALAAILGRANLRTRDAVRACVPGAPPNPDAVVRGG